jgi:hypothetical protein
VRRTDQPADGVTIAVEAAVRVATFHGIGTATPSVIQETNNVVIRLAPHDVIAKVGRWPHSVGALRREHAAATHLASVDAPIAPPLPDVGPIVDDETGFVVTFWRAVDVQPDLVVRADDAARALQVVHSALAGYEAHVPDVREHIWLARAALNDDGAMRALPESDRELLGRAIDALTDRIAAFGAATQVLHGEPHLGNVLATPDGARWIDLEDVCVGPLEWDVAFLPEGTESLFDGVDPSLMALVRTLNSACVATWCWVRADDEEMRSHAEHHLERVRAGFGG